MALLSAHFHFTLDSKFQYEIYPVPLLVLITSFSSGIVVDILICDIGAYGCLRWFVEGLTESGDID
jgi:hypothetical protein